MYVRRVLEGIRSFALSANVGFMQNAVALKANLLMLLILYVENVEKVMLSGCSLEVMDRFCYLGDMLDACGGAESSTITRIRSGWKKFRELLPLLTTKATSLKIRGEIYATCVRSVMLYGSETWPVKVEDSQRLHRNEMSMMLDVWCFTERQIFL